MEESAAHKKRFTERYGQMPLSKPFLQESPGYHCAFWNAMLY